MPIVAMTRLGVRGEFADLALLKARLKDLGAQIKREDFDATGVTLDLLLSEHLAAAL